jgi:hypothetical protein
MHSNRGIVKTASENTGKEMACEVTIIIYAILILMLIGYNTAVRIS